MKLKITVHGVAYEVDVEVLDAQDEMQDSGSPLPGPATAVRDRGHVPDVGGGGPAGASYGPPAGALADPCGGVVSPIAGTVLEVKCKTGDQVTAGQILVVIEAMKMETEIAAPGAGLVKAVPVAPGDAIRENQMLVEFE